MSLGIHQIVNKLFHEAFTSIFSTSSDSLSSFRFDSLSSYPPISRFDQSEDLRTYPLPHPHHPSPPSSFARMAFLEVASERRDGFMVAVDNASRPGRRRASFGLVPCFLLDASPFLLAPSPMCTQPGSIMCPLSLPAPWGDPPLLLCLRHSCRPSSYALWTGTPLGRPASSRAPSTQLALQLGGCLPQLLAPSLRVPSPTP